MRKKLLKKQKRELF